MTPIRPPRDDDAAAPMRADGRGWTIAGPRERGDMRATPWTFTASERTRAFDARHGRRVEGAPGDDPRAHHLRLEVDR